MGGDKTGTASPVDNDDDNNGGGLQRLHANHDHGILTTKDGTPLIRLRSKKSIMESRFKLTMRTWDDVWKSTAWAKFAPDKLKQTLQRSSRNHGEVKAGSATGDVGASGDTTAVAIPTAAPAGVQVKKSRFRVVPHVQIGDQPTPLVHSKRSTPKPPLSSSSGSSDTDSDRLPAGLPMIESNLNELTMVESELKKLEREHVAKHQLLTPKSNGNSTEKTSTADDGAVANDGRKQQQQQRVGDGKKDKSAAPKVGSRAAETHSKRLGWLKAFRRKSSADTSSESSAAHAQPAVATAAPKPIKHKQQTKSSSSSTGGKQSSSSSSPKQQQKQRASTARPRQHHARATAVPAAVTSTATPVSHTNLANTRFSYTYAYFTNILMYIGIYYSACVYGVIIGRVRLGNR